MRHLLALAAFVVVALLGDRLVATLLEHVVAASEFRYSRLYGGHAQADIVSFGNSRGVHALFNPELERRTCRRVFNGAYNGLSPQLMHVLFEDYLRLDGTPKVALFEASAQSTVHERTINEFRTYAPFSPALAALYAEQDRGYPVWRHLTHLYYFNSEMFLRALYYRHRSDQDWTLGDARFDPLQVIAYQHRGGGEAGGDDAGRTSAFHAIAQAARAHGVTALFYVAPYHRAISVDDRASLAWIDHLRDALRGEAEVLDFSAALPADEDFADLVHVNRRGSEATIAALLATPAGATLSACP